MRIILLLFICFTLHTVHADVGIRATLQADRCDADVMKTVGNAGTTNTGGVCTAECTLNLNTTRLSCEMTFNSGSAEKVTGISIHWGAVPPAPAGNKPFQWQTFSPTADGIAMGSLTSLNAGSGELNEVWRRNPITKSWVQFDTNTNPSGSFAGLFKFETVQLNSAATLGMNVWLCLAIIVMCHIL